MASEKSVPTGGILRDLFGPIVRGLASLQLAVALIVVLAAVLACATFLEAAHGRPYAQWYVYHSQWFLALLTLLAVNIFAATVVRFPWRGKLGFLVTHTGLLVLLAGAIQTFLGGIEGQVSVQEGATANRMLLNDYSRFTIRWQAEPGQSRPVPASFVFQPGPVDWPDGMAFDMGEISGVALKVMKFYTHAVTEEEWVEDRSEKGSPALRLALAGADGATVAEEWLTADPFGGQISFGPIGIELQQVPANSMLDDFLHPPGKDMDQHGVLSVHYQDKMVRLPVSKNVGKKVPVGSSGLEVEIAQYLPNATPDAGGRFSSTGDEPKNPFVELQVYLPQAKEPLRQIAFAKIPLLNLDLVHGGACPVKFWYHHPAAAPQPGVEFLQTPDGKLHCRINDASGYEQKGVLREGDELALAAGFKLLVRKHVRHARQEVRFRSVEVAPGESEGPEAAALVEIAAGGSTQQVWIKRNDQKYGMQTLGTPEGALAIDFGYEYAPLDFSLKLLKFTRGLNPGGMGAASFTSTVQVIDRGRGIDQIHEISMNQPLAHDRFTFYQASYEDSPDGHARSVLSVACDPGRLLKYLGSLMICVGIAWMFLVRTEWAQDLRRLLGFGGQQLANGSGSAGGPADSPSDAQAGRLAAAGSSQSD